MNALVKISKVGNSSAVILSKDVLSRLGAAQGDTLSISDTKRGIELRLQDDDFETQMAAAREVMMRRKRALRELAK